MTYVVPALQRQTRKKRPNVCTARPRCRTSLSAPNNALSVRARGYTESVRRLAYWPSADESLFQLKKAGMFAEKAPLCFSRLFLCLLGAAIKSVAPSQRFTPTGASVSVGSLLRRPRPPLPPPPVATAAAIRPVNCQSLRWREPMLP